MNHQTRNSVKTSLVVVLAASLTFQANAGVHQAKDKDRKAEEKKHRVAEVKKGEATPCRERGQELRVRGGSGGESGEPLTRNQRVNRMEIETPDKAANTVIAKAGHENTEPLVVRRRDAEPVERVTKRVHDSVAVMGGGGGGGIPVMVEHTPGQVIEEEGIRLGHKHGRRHLGVTTLGPVENLLARAYSLLSRADHDYLGHRIAALRDISGAAAALGFELQGRARVNEPQTTSDEQLKAGQDLLGSARVLLADSGEAEATGKLDDAVEQINVALNIR